MSDEGHSGHVRLTCRPLGVTLRRHQKHIEEHLLGRWNDGAGVESVARQANAAVVTVVLSKGVVGIRELDRLHRFVDFRLRSPLAWMHV